MRTQAKFKEYIWLVNTINKARAISFADMDFEITMRPTVDFFGSQVKQLKFYSNGK